MTAVDVDLFAYYTEIIEQPAARASVRLEARHGTVRARVELTVRSCPAPGHPWVVVLNSDELELHGFATLKEACRYYSGLVLDCEDDYARYGDHAWHSTDVPGVPVLPAP